MSSAEEEEKGRRRRWVDDEAARAVRGLMRLERRDVDRAMSSVGCLP